MVDDIAACVEAENNPAASVGAVCKGWFRRATACSEAVFPQLPGYLLFTMRATSIAPAPCWPGARQHSSVVCTNAL